MRLARFAVRRIVLLIGTLVGVSIVTFGLTNVVPGDVAVMILGTRGDEQQLEILREQLGLNRPLYVQYLDWAVSTLSGDLGESLRFGDPVATLIKQRFPASALLAVSAMIVAVSISIPLGVIAAMDENTWKDFGASIAAFVGISLPGFFWGIVLILVFARYAGLFPPSGYVSPLEDPLRSLKHIVLPAVALGFGLMAHLTRMTRSSLLEELRAGYIKLAESKGLSERRIVYRHAMRNAFLPILTVMGFQLAFLFGGVVVIEEVFAYPGLGRLAYQALLNRDVPLIQGTILVFAVIFTVSNLVVDLLYAVLDPRVGEGGT
ncbi:MAG: ABC transporter permease [Halobacteriota archaeon]